MTGVYGIYCSETKKWYVGASSNIKYRIRALKSELRCEFWTSKKGLHQDVHKYGFYSITFIILEKCDLCELVEKEQYWINELDSINNGYNTQASGKNRYWGS
jgi:group I intron endonuclease